MKSISNSLLILFITLSSYAYADIEIPCQKQDQSVLCPAEIRNKGSQTMLAKLITSGQNHQIPGKNSEKLTLEFAAKSESTFNLVLLDDASQKNGCNYVFIVKEKNGTFYADYHILSIVGEPKMCGIGGSFALTVSADIDLR